MYIKSPTDTHKKHYKTQHSYVLDNCWLVITVAFSNAKFKIKEIEEIDTSISWRAG